MALNIHGHGAAIIRPELSQQGNQARRRTSPEETLTSSFTDEPEKGQLM